ncbi:hypothetical protein CDAR_596981 [Caerostris darwini]|uniref:Uncharacterized protein n=1 Tax=Caerostris darwini TaxID=1538125 RepID=A0AAV4U2B6_9ARAC|nr:hypothetical protein CDAR_596981 [Caerostris darwini]
MKKWRCNVENLHSFHKESPWRRFPAGSGKRFVEGNNAFPHHQSVGRPRDRRGERGGRRRLHVTPDIIVGAQQDGQVQAGSPDRFLGDLPGHRHQEGSPYLQGHRRHVSTMFGDQ